MTRAHDFLYIVQDDPLCACLTHRSSLHPDLSYRSLFVYTRLFFEYICLCCRTCIHMTTLSSMSRHAYFEPIAHILISFTDLFTYIHISFSNIYVSVVAPVCAGRPSPACRATRILNPSFTSSVIFQLTLVSGGASVSGKHGSRGAENRSPGL